MRFYRLITLLLIFFGQSTFGQGTIMDQVQKYFEGGDFQSALDLIHGMNKRHPNSEALRIKALCHLYLNDRPAADSAARWLLETDPGYKDRPHDDPPEMIQLLAKYEAMPKIITGLKLGWNGSSVRVLQSYSPAASQITYYPQDGLEKGATFHFQAGLHIHWMAHQKIGIVTEPSILRTSLKKYMHNIAGWESQAFEEWQVFEMPVSIRFAQRKKRFQPYLELGMVYGNLRSSFAEFSSRQLSGARVEVIQSYDTHILRQTHQWSFAGGIGMRVRTNRAWIIGGISYQYGWKTANNADNRYVDPILIFDQQYVDDDFTLDYVRLNLVIAPFLTKTPGGYKAIRTGR